MQGDDLEFIDISDESVSYFIRCEHLARYIYASEQIRKRRAKYVLDAACGSGYGTVEIAKYADTVIGLDKNPPFKQYIKDNISYIQSDLDADDFIIPIEQGKKLETVVCFETLEHLENPKKFLSIISSCLKNKGLLFVSVPNGDFEKTDENGKVINPFHLHKFQENNMTEMLVECGFQIKRVLYQPTSAQLYRNQARAIRDLNLDNEYAKKMSPDTGDMYYYARVYAWPDENKGQSYSIMYMCERKY
ncbi:MAG: class I SAM-dependent methyltransferase [Eubacteriales bacterium]